MKLILKVNDIPGTIKGLGLLYSLVNFFDREL